MSCRCPCTQTLQCYKVRGSTEGFGKSTEVKAMFWSERQLPQGQAKINFVHDLAGSSYIVVSLLPAVLVFLGPR